MKDPVDVLAIGAHPDDAEVGCGATLILASIAGCRVAVADLTLGEKGTRGSPELRDRERLKAAEVVGLSERPCLGLPDAALGSTPDHLAAVIRLVRAFRPQVVLAPFPGDRHPDHAAAGRLTREACYLAGLAKLDGLPPHRPTCVFHYMLHDMFEPSFVIDVSSAWERKLEAVMAYASQFGPEAPTGAVTALPEFLAVVDARATVHGALVGAERGEAFYCKGPVPLKVLPGMARDQTRGGRPARYTAAW